MTTRKIKTILILLFALHPISAIGGAYKNTDDFIAKRFVEISTTETTLREVRMIVSALQEEDKKKFTANLQTFRLKKENEAPCSFDPTIFAYSENTKNSGESLYFCRHSLALYANAISILTLTPEIKNTEFAFTEMANYIIDRFYNKNLPLCSVAQGVVLLKDERSLSTCATLNQNSAENEFEQTMRTLFRSTGIDEKQFPEGFAHEFIYHMETQTIRTLFEYIVMHEAIHISRNHNQNKHHYNFENIADRESLKILSSFDLSAPPANVRRGVLSSYISMSTLLLGTLVREKILERSSTSTGIRLDPHSEFLLCSYKRFAAASPENTTLTRNFKNVQNEIEKRNINCRHN